METQTESVDTAIDEKSIRYISLIGGINPISQAHLLETCYQFHHEGVETVHLFMSTPGGSVHCGVSIYNVLTAMPFTLITHNVGLVASIGNVVFLAGEMRFAVKTGCFLFHEVHMSYPGNKKISRHQIDEWTDIIQFSEHQIREVLMDRTSISNDVIEESFKRQSTQNADFALTNNIIHGVEPLNITNGAQITAIRTE